MGDKKLNWPRYSNLSLLSQPPKIRCACNFVSAWKASWWSCMLQTQSCARKALNQTQTGAGRGSWAPSYQLCPLVLSPALGSLCFFKFFYYYYYYLQVWAISTSSCSSHQQRCWYNFQRRTRGNHSNSANSSIYPEVQGKVYCCLAQPTFSFQLDEGDAFKSSEAWYRDFSS